jgi:hypothetical protein
MALAVGAHSITAVYEGDANFTGSASDAVGETVNQADSTTSLVSSANPSSPGQSISFTATVSAVAPGTGTPSGTIQFSIDGSPFGSAVALVGGVAESASISTLSGGSHTVTAAYSGDPDFVASTASDFTQVVQVGLPTTTTLTVTINPSVYGQAVTFTATVAGSGGGKPTGTVEFMDSSTVLATATLSSTGRATYRTNALVAGSHAITAVYSGDTKFADSTSPVLTQTINPANTTTTVTSGKNPSVFGQSVTFTAVVKAQAPGSGTSTGTVTFYDGSTALATSPLNINDHATLTISALSVGTHSITAVYSGDPNFTTSTSKALTQTVNQAKSKANITSSANPSVSSQSVTFTAKITAVAPGSGTPTGTVTFMDGATAIGTGTLDETGTATFTTSSLSVGTHAIAAVYSGDVDFLASTSNVVSERVNQAKTATGVVSSLNPSAHGMPVTFTATVSILAPGSGMPTGTVTFKEGNSVLATVALAGGSASFTTRALAIGTHSIRALYSGDVNFAGSTSAVLSQVVQISTSASVPALEPGLVDQVLGSLVPDDFSGLSASASLRSAYSPSRRRAAAPGP